jgi:hypothetical protein
MDFEKRKIMWRALLKITCITKKRIRCVLYISSKQPILTSQDFEKKKKYLKSIYVT